MFFGLAKPHQKKRENFFRTAIATNTTTTTLQCQHNSRVHLLSTSRLKPYSIMMFFAKKSAPLSVPLSATPPPQRRERTTRITLTHYFCSTFQAWGRPRCLNLPKLDSYNRTLLLQLLPIVKCAFQLLKTLHTGVLNNLFVTTSNPD